jgi:G3E family GTPase
MGWKTALRESRAEEHEAAAHDHGTAHAVDSFVYRRERPFDPDALADRLVDRPAGVIRAKGVCYVAGTDDVIGMNRAGDVVQAGAIGEWGDDKPRTELVFIGTEMDRASIDARLDDCLVDAASVEEGVEMPFPIESTADT